MIFAKKIASSFTVFFLFCFYGKTSVGTDFNIILTSSIVGLEQLDSKLAHGGFDQHKIVLGAFYNNVLGHHVIKHVHTMKTPKKPHFI